MSPSPPLPSRPIDDTRCAIRDAAARDAVPAAIVTKDLAS